MSVLVPVHLQERASRDFGKEGVRWLDALPAHVEALEREWSLTALRPFEIDSACSWVAPVRLADGSAAVLKIGVPHREARHEAAALHFFDGRGAVRLLRVSEDGFSLLIERCVPGADLWTLAEEEANAAGAAILQRLWREPPPAAPFERLADLAEQWCDELPSTAPAAGYDPALIGDAVARARELADTQPRLVLLHGDFHPGNVLSAAREPWLAIDPKPLVGEPAYDLAQWLGNRCEAAQRSPHPVAAMRWQIDQLSGLLELEPGRVAGWAFVKSLGWDWGPPSARLFHQALTENDADVR